MVDINFHPKTIQPGDDLRVTCNIALDDPAENKFKTMLRCPFYEKEQLCIANCDSQIECTEDLCDRKRVRGQHFQCDNKVSSNTISYSYLFESLSNLVIMGRPQLTFKCSYKGIYTSGIVNISNKTRDRNPSTKKENNEMVIQRPEFTIPPQIIKTNHPNNETGLLKPHDLILVGLLVALFISVVINFWCGIKWCIRCCKNSQFTGFNKSHIHLNEMYLNQLNAKENSNCDNNLIPPYYSYDHIKRAISQPTLSHPDNNIPPRFVSNNVNQLNSGSVNYKPKFKSSLQTFDEYDLNNGSERSLLNPVYGQMVIAPIQCLDPSMIPYLNPLSKSYSQQMHINTDSDQVQNNLDIFVEEIPNKRDTSINQELPRKPD